jgi:hypothetical protein
MLDLTQDSDIEVIYCLQVVFVGKGFIGISKSLTQ